MEFDLNDEQCELRDTARRFLEREAPVSYAREMMDDPRGYSADIWKHMAELGWMSLPFAEQYGGLNMGFISLALLVAEMGRVVLPGPYLSSIAVAGTTIAAAGSDEQRARLLPAIAAGDSIAAFAAEPGHVTERDGLLHGTRRLVPDGHIADVVIVVAHTAADHATADHATADHATDDHATGDHATDDHATAGHGTDDHATDGAGLFIAEPTARRAVETLDRTRICADLTFDGARAERLGTSTIVDVHRAFDRAAVAVAAEMLGLAERVLELSVDYAKAREQFGRPIGSFQAVKHRAADMLVDLESLRSAVYYAAWAIERDHPDATLAASVAKAWASDAATRIAKSGIQIHGGVGFTWEHDMHLYFKRAKADQVAFGDASLHRERIAVLARARAGN